MGATMEWNPDFEAEVIEEVRPQIREAAEQIAADTEAGLQFPGGRSSPVEVTDTALGATVAITGPFGHLEEWGGAKSPPRAPLRRAAEASGLELDWY